MTDTISTTDPKPGFRFKDLGKMFGGSTGSGRQFGILGALVVIILFFQWQTGGKTLTPQNLINIVNGNSYVLILAVGMVLVIIAGHIDLSVGSVAAFVGIVVAQFMKWANFGVLMAGAPEWLPPLVTVLSALIVGLIVAPWSVRGRAGGSPTSAFPRSS